MRSKCHMIATMKVIWTSVVYQKTGAADCAVILISVLIYMLVKGLKFIFSVSETFNARPE